MPLPTFNFSQLNKQQQLAMQIGVPVIAAVILIFLCYRSLTRLGADPLLPVFMQRPNGVWGQIRTKEQEIAKLEEVINEGPAVTAKLKALQAEIKLAEERLPTEAEKAEMSELITRLGREIPSEIGIIQFKKVEIKESKAQGGPKSKTTDDYQTVTYRTEVEGDFNGIVKYIDSIEKNPRFMTIKELNVKPGTLTVDKPNQKIVYGLHAVTMEIVTYVYNPATKAPKPQ
jgi:Tfp pilus assembly protein PilO